MKRLLFFLLLPTGFAFSQASFFSNDLVVSNIEKDTVYVKNDPTGKNIYYSWLMDPYYGGKKVTPVLVEDLTPYHQRYEMICSKTNSPSNKRKRSKKN
jgi:hypothetical protein